MNHLGRYSEFAIPHSRRDSTALLIPDSPPPAYTPINIIIDEIQRNSPSNELVTSAIDIFSRKCFVKFVIKSISFTLSKQK